jgi:hypothetical protein
MSQNPKSKLSNTGLDFTKTIHCDPYDFVKPEQFDLNGKAVLITGASKGVSQPWTDAKLSTHCNTDTYLHRLDVQLP